MGPLGFLVQKRSIHGGEGHPASDGLGCKTFRNRPSCPKRARGWIREVAFSQVGRQLLEVHVGIESPESWDQREALSALSGTTGSVWRHDESPRPQLATREFPWERLGFVPRFVGSESASCVAALQPSIFYNQGDVELRRFLDGAAARNESALLLSMIGGEKSSGNPFAPNDSSVLLPGDQRSIGGRFLPSGTRPDLVDGLGPAERDLGLRLKNRSPDSRWWAVGPAALDSVRGDGSGRPFHEPGGTFQPILVSALGEPLAGVWIPEDVDWRWYVVPWSEDWQQLVEWLGAQAVPQHIPSAFRRVNASELVDDELLTDREMAARTARDEFEQATSTERARLQEEWLTARAQADDVRSGLLYGSGRDLVVAVAGVLEQADFEVEDLDQSLGSGVSADLLASKGNVHRLVEVKSAGGSAGENLLDDLQRHLRTWPQLNRQEALDGGVLVVNHQLRLPPLDRDAAAYSRAEFISSLPSPVVPSLAMFGWWRDGDFGAIEMAFTGNAQVFSADLRRHR